MADAVVSCAIQKLGDFIIQEAAALKGIKGDVEELERELGFMQSYLIDAEQKHGSDERMRTWISEIQGVAYDTEDIIEKFIFKVNNEPIHSSKWGRMSSSMRNCFCCCCKNANLYDIGKDIEALKKRVLEISWRRVTYGINNLGVKQNNWTSGGGGLRAITLYGDEYLDVVGFEDDYRDLQKKLFDDAKSCSVISIFGMGGLGKTTLAKKLYNNNKTEFPLRAWIRVSKEWKTDDLLRKLIKSFVDNDEIKKVVTMEPINDEIKKVDTMELINDEIKKVDTMELINDKSKKVDTMELINDELEMVNKMELFQLVLYLSNLLEKRRYLVVIDDLWHREAWESIKNALPDNKNGSRIIITTRIEDVAELQDHTTLVLKLHFLRDEDSWFLFCKKAFPDKNGVCPDELERLGKEMTAKCGGLPLAIIMLGGLLSRKEFYEWPAVKEHIWREVEEDSIHNIRRILDVSYNDLPNNIKSCFLYLGIFPEDALIQVEDLVKLWVAEGFIPIDEEGRTPEEISEGYFKELLGRNLLQTVEENWRITSSCRVHGLVQYLALKKARETNFLCVHDQIGSSFSLHTTPCRRFAVHSGSAHEEFLNHSHKKVRTLYLLNDSSSINHLKNVSIVWSFRLLRVLELEGVDFSGEKKSLFLEVGEMIHLRYLGLKNTNVDELPNSIGNLKVLQTLNIKSSGVVRPITLPKDVCKLKELRHLMGMFWEEDFPNLVGLYNLQTLELSIRSKMMESVFDSECFSELYNLRTLRIDLSIGIIISIEPLLRCKQLIELKITGKDKVREVPKDIHKYLTKLKYVELFLSEYEKDPIPEFERLPSLLALHLSCDVEKTKRWTFTQNGFPQLKFLKLGNALNMELSVEEGAMPNLQFLCLEDDELKQTLFPERFWSLPGEKAMNWTFYKY